MKLKNKINSTIIEVSTEHAINVLLPQGQWEEVSIEKKEEVVKTINVRGKKK